MIRDKVIYIKQQGLKFTEIYFSYIIQRKNDGHYLDQFYRIFIDFIQNTNEMDFNL